MTASDYKKYWEGKTFKAHTPAQPTKAGEGKGDWLQCQACKLSMS
jgi:sphingomyelin phosphodiesterase